MGNSDYRSADALLDELERLEELFRPRGSNRMREWMEEMGVELKRLGEKEMLDVQASRDAAREDVERFIAEVQRTTEKNLLCIEKMDGMRVEKTEDGEVNWREVYSRIECTKGTGERKDADLAKGIISKILTQSSPS